MSSTAALAQRAQDNVVAAAGDAFGTSVGQESTGIYTDADTRGFSPLDAGNARIDGVYYDPVGQLPSRVRRSTTIRVGFAAVEYPFPAPTGIVDYQLHPLPIELGASIGATLNPFGGHLLELDLRIPIIAQHLSLTGGFAHSENRQSDGARAINESFAIRPFVRFGQIEIVPFLSRLKTTDRAHPLVVVAGAQLPELPENRRYLGQDWAVGRRVTYHYGFTARAPITEAFSLRAGIFRGITHRRENYSEIFSIIGETARANHLVIADPPQDVSALSGEVMAALRLGNGRATHRLLAGYRGRNRYTETGGSDRRNLGQVDLGSIDVEPEPVFAFGPVNAGRVRQSSWMLGYLGQIERVGNLNLGLQRASYRAQVRNGGTGGEASSREQAWLYNAMVSFVVTPSISVYAGTERGLEDSGLAPESAANRNEQLPATQTTQYEAGIRLKASRLQLVVSGFQISKPYFSFDAANRYERVGSVRNRGIEASLAGRIGQRFDLIAGAVLMQPRVNGAAVELGTIGKRPAKISPIQIRIDANYRTDILNGLTPTFSFQYYGERPVTSRPVAALGRQLMLPASGTFDLGFRKQFKIGSVPASVRALVQNVFDAKNWRVVSANTLYPDERRRFTLNLAADL